VIVIAVLLALAGPWRSRWRAPAAIAGSALALLIVYATASSLTNGRFEFAPAQGWHLYARVAPFADCNAFSPPAGTSELCESTPIDERSGYDYYFYDERSPAHRALGAVGEEDGKAAAFSRAAILNQPGAYLSAVWEDVRGYYAPSAYPFKVGAGSDLDPQLDWTWTLGPGTEDVPVTESDIATGMESFFDPFAPKARAGGLHLLRDLRHLARFGATALAISTILVLLGLTIGPARNRVGVLLFGVGGLAILLLPLLSIYYVARYSVPVAPLISAGAALSMLSLWRLEAERRREREPLQ
jgi:hypothetical protein